MKQQQQQQRHPRPEINSFERNVRRLQDFPPSSEIPAVLAEAVRETGATGTAAGSRANLARTRGTLRTRGPVQFQFPFSGG